ncbi:MAG TPA: Holliday junction resolvase RuvX [Gemmatales bacterium]|nr:Holliday junction resolvase RuvX [Gemmatales bacterium]
MLEDSLPLPPGPLLGIDFGTVRIGLALSDRNQTIAAPFQLYERKTVAEDAAYFQKLVQQEKVVGIVLGLPVHLSGDESKKSKQVKEFANWLRKHLSVPIAFCDERFTSVFAWDQLKADGLKASQRRKQLDKVAAQMILQHYLDEQKSPHYELPRGAEGEGEVMREQHD